MRSLLGCSADYTAPCREFAGDCADLQAQFKDVPDSGIPEEYECTAFPDEKSARDKIIVGLICFAVGLPFTMVLEELFAVSNEPEFLEAQLTHPLWMRFVYGKPNWYFAKRPPGLVKFISLRMSHEPKKIVIELALMGFEYARFVVRSALASAIGLFACHRARVEPEPRSEQSEQSEAAVKPEGEASPGGPVAEAYGDVWRRMIAAGRVAPGDAQLRAYLHALDWRAPPRNL